VFQYRQILARMRQGDSDRDIARSRLMGRRKAAELREIALQHGWLDREAPLPEDAAIAALVPKAKTASSSVSSAEPFREQIARWTAANIDGTTIHATLVRSHGYTGSYS